MGAPTGMWECKKCGDYNPNYAKECQHCKAARDSYTSKPAVYSKPVAVSGASSSKKDNRFSVQGHRGESTAETFFNVIAWIIWIGGVIAAFALSWETNYYGNGSWNFGTFLLYVVIFGVVGLTYHCLAELFGNIATIAASVKDMTVTQIAYRDDAQTEKLAGNVAAIAQTLQAIQARMDEKKPEEQNQETVAE